MSAYFNQTNLSPGTPFSSGGGNTFNQLFANQIVSATNGVYETRYDLSGTGILNKVKDDKFIISYGTQTDSRIELVPTSGNTIGFYGTSAGGVALTGNNDPANYGISYTLMSSITGTTSFNTIDVNGLISTLKVVYPPIVK